MLEWLLPLLRAIHIACGVYWAGTIFFFVELLEPSLRASGPPGGRVMRELIRKGYLRTLPAVAILTVASGLWLYWIVSGHLSAAWGHTRFGTSITVGAVAGIVALVIGLAKLRPTGLKVAALIDRMMEADSEEDRGAIMAEIDPLRNSLRTWGRVTAAFLIVAVIGMAIARYL